RSCCSTRTGSSGRRWPSRSTRTAAPPSRRSRRRNVSPEPVPVPGTGTGLFRKPARRCSLWVKEARMRDCPECGGPVEARFHYCPWCSAPQRRKLVEFFRPHEELEGDQGKALRVSRYFGSSEPERHVRFSVWNETGSPEAAVSLDEEEAQRLARSSSCTARPRLRGRACWRPCAG